MGRQDEESLKLAATVIVIILALIAVIWAYKVRFEDCMEEKHDKFFCEIYARGGR